MYQAPLISIHGIGLNAATSLLLELLKLDKAAEKALSKVIVLPGIPADASELLMQEFPVLPLPRHTFPVSATSASFPCTTCRLSLTFPEALIPVTLPAALRHFACTLGGTYAHAELRCPLRRALTSPIAAAEGDETPPLPPLLHPAARSAMHTAAASRVRCRIRGNLSPTNTWPRWCRPTPAGTPGQAHRQDSYRTRCC